MPLTQIDSVAALVVIDLQKGLLNFPTVDAMGTIILRAAELTAAFRSRGLPVVLVNATGAAPGRTDSGPRTFSFPPDWTEFVPQLDQQASDHVVSKQRWGAFHGTDLDEFLRSRSVTQVVLAGVATGAGVESTARSAYDLGYNVVLVVDAMTDRDADAQRHCIEKIFPRIGETTTTRDLLRSMAG